MGLWVILDVSATVLQFYSSTVLQCYCSKRKGDTPAKAQDISQGRNVPNKISLHFVALD